MNASRFFEVPVISIGEVRPERLEGATAEVLADREGVYRKLVHHHGRLAGAILYGDISDAGLFYRLYRVGYIRPLQGSTGAPVGVGYIRPDLFTRSQGADKGAT